MTPTPCEQRLGILAGELTHLNAVEPKIDVGLLGLAAGALYALRSAISLDYDNARGKAPDLHEFEPEFRETLACLSRGEEPPREWLGGFHFVSALLRLAALIDRLGKPPFDDWPNDELRGDVMDDAERIKHGHWKPGRNPYFAHPAEPLETSVDDALTVAAAICERLQDRAAPPAEER